MLISVKISRNSAFAGSDKPRMLLFLLINVNSWHFNIYEQERTSCSAELGMKLFITLGPGLIVIPSHNKDVEGI